MLVRDHAKRLFYLRSKKNAPNATLVIDRGPHPVDTVLPAQMITVVESLLHADIHLGATVSARLDDDTTTHENMEGGVPPGPA